MASASEGMSGQTRALRCFRRSNRQSLLVPVHILKTKALDLTDAQSIDGKQEQDGPVAYVGFPIRFCTGQEPLNVGP